MTVARGVVITGVGLLSAAGNDLNKLGAAGAAGVGLESAVRLVDTAPFGVRTAAGVEFDPAQHLGTRGLRTLDRATKMGLVASHLAAAHAGLEPGTSGLVGVCVGATYGQLGPAGEFDRGVLTSGPDWVNPAMFPFTVYTSHAGYIAIRHQATGPNLTVVSGVLSAFDAINAAAALIENDECDCVFAGGFEPFSFDYFGHLSMLGVLGRESPGSCRLPYVPGSSGVVAGEGACLFVLESEEHARKRGARPLGRIHRGDTEQAESLDQEGLARALESSIGRTLARASVGVDDVAWVSGSGSGWELGDRAEVEGVRRSLAGASRTIPLASIKTAIGETCSAAGGFQVAAALVSFVGGGIPKNPQGTPFKNETIPGVGLGRDATLRVLCTGVGWTGQAGSLLVTQERG